MNGTIIFVGPSLARADVSRVGAGLRPPARQGDLYRAARAQPAAIGLIDGCFESVPSVWHKEILWALSSGIPVWGGASIGALRAAELVSFGMRGVGAVFEAYRDGVLEDDDEVALLHGPAETGYLPLTEAMVNVRATLAAAAGAGVLTPAVGCVLAVVAKAMFYKDRTWPAVLREAEEFGVPQAALAALAAWLPHGRIDVKQSDAAAMLAAMRVTGASVVPSVSFIMAPTAAWHAAVGQAGTGCQEEASNPAAIARISTCQRAKGGETSLSRGYCF